MSAQVTHPAFAHKLPAQTFTAWRIPTGSGPDCRNAIPLAIEGAETPDDALAQALSGALQHKDHVAILQDHTGRRNQTLRLYAIKQESQRKWRRDPVTGETVADRRLYPVLVFELPAGFAPIEPWQWTPGADVVGIDRDLVEAK